MRHDARCELTNPRPLYLGPSCKCASRAYALCDGCRSGMHLRHTEVADDENGPDRTCRCDLCEVAA